MQRIAAITLIIGTAVAWFGESRPIITEIFGGAPDPQLVIDNNPSAWTTAMLLMGIGAVVIAAGLVLLARHLQTLSEEQAVKRASTIAAALALLGGLAYATGRTISAVTQLWDSPYELPIMVMWITFSIGWQVALILTGYALLRTGYPKWLGWPVIVIPALILVGVVITGGLPPGLYYFAVLFLGIGLLFVREPQPAAMAQFEGSSA
jgi:hypothetical protein